MIVKAWFEYLAKRKNREIARRRILRLFDLYYRQFRIPGFTTSFPESPGTEEEEQIRALWLGLMRH